MTVRALAPPRITVSKHAPSGKWRWDCSRCGFAAYESTQQAAFVNGEAHYIARHLGGQRVELGEPWWL